MTTENEIEEAAANIQAMVSGGRTIEQACEAFLKYGLDPAIVTAARVLYEKRVGIISQLKEPVTIVSSEGRVNWYSGPTGEAPYWTHFKANVAESLPEDVRESAVRDIDDATSRILDLAGAPGWAEIRTKGLVLGYVQSGKTTNFMGVMAKAADAGYRLFIVLSGITDNLRSQTQERIEEMLVGGHPERWYLLTDLDNDFTATSNAAKLLSDQQNRLIAVVKKNGFRLRRLNEWIRSAGSEITKTVPIMVIDDEADQASLDVGKRGRISRINGLIGQIIAHQRSSYVAYTATPFANLLTDTDRYESLYPDDFIVEMKKPDGYFGPERLFGREALTEDEPDDVQNGLDVIRIIDDSEAAMAKPPTGKGAVYGWEPAVTPALEAAITWYLLATAARRARSGVSNHSTMLIHTSMLAEAHNRLRETVEDHVLAIAAKYARDAGLRESFCKVWLKESTAVPAQSVGLPEVTWDEVDAAMPGVLAAIRVIADNYTSQDRLYYTRDDPATVIVVGGNTLSRGLTLEGLVSSYFVRAASAYDTLLQMGRWFGYRRGYEDLPRIWMPEDLAHWFQDLATVEEEIRRDIRSFGPDTKPKDVGVRIRVHPSMAITSAAKMRGAVDAEVSYDLKREQTIVFQHRDEGWLTSNIAATRRLMIDAKDLAATFSDNADAGRVLIKRVPSERILQFFNEYRMHPNALRLRTDLITGYIRQQMDQGALKTWNVVLLENPSRVPAEDLDLGIGRAVRTVERSRLQRFSAHANIKSLVSTIDRIADTGISRAQLPSDVKANDDKSLAKYRQDIVGDVGLIVVYPIDKNSRVRETSATDDKRPRDPRVDLEAVEHIIGLGIYFPAAVGKPTYQYKTADIKQPVEDDSDEFDAIEREDEARDLARGSAESAADAGDAAAGPERGRKGDDRPAASTSPSKQGR